MATICERSRAVTCFASLVSAKYHLFGHGGIEIMGRPLRLANTFDEIARSFLSNLGFELVNDPNKFTGQYLATNAVYKSPNGLFLLVGFDPLDGSNAGMLCGRRWNFTSQIPGFLRIEKISNDYSVLARRFGFELPRTYKLDVDDLNNADIRLILKDLEDTLPTILERVTLDDLIAVEREEYGCQWRLDQGWYQSTTFKFEGITPFVEN